LSVADVVLVDLSKIWVIFRHLGKYLVISVANLFI
jgi:hypothetical protein